MTGSLGYGLLWFVLILALIPLALWLLKRTPYGAAMAGAGAVTRTVASMPLGPHQRLVTVEVGEGAERRWLVLGVTAQQISTLHTMAPQGEPAAATPPQMHPTFAKLLDKVRDARR